MYHLANLVINLSALDFFSPELDISSTILLTAESLYSFVAKTVIEPLFNKQPEYSFDLKMVYSDKNHAKVI